MPSRRRIVLGSLAVLMMLVVGTVVLRSTSDDREEAGSPGTASFLEPPDGRWLTDDRGRQYFVMRVPREEVQRRNDGTYVTRGIPLTIVEKDERYYHVKVFRTTDAAPDAPSASDVEASYRVSTKPSSRLRTVPFGRGLPSSGQWRNNFAVADMNGDRELDIVHGPPRKGGGVPRIFLGDGEGSFQRWDDARFPSLGYDYGGVSVGDLNDDGINDIVLGIHLAGTTVLLGDEGGRFTRADDGLDAPSGDRPPAFTSQALALVDWDEDGDSDILALGEGPRPGGSGQTRDAGARGFVLYRGDGSGHWDGVHIESEVFGQSLAIGDVNDDGRTDAIASSSTFGRTDIVMLGTRDGGWRIAKIARIRPNAYVRSVAVDDLDEDGRDDVAVGYASLEADVWRTGIDLFFSRSNGRWRRSALTVERGSHGVSAIAAGDVDADGRRDIVAVTGDGETLVFPGDGRRTFTRERRAVPRYTGSCRGSHVALADLDGDDGDEIIASFADEDCETGGGIRAWKLR